MFLMINVNMFTVNLVFSS